MARCLSTVTRLALVVLALALAVSADAARAGEARLVTIDKADCARLVAHQPAPDVAYQPGIDGQGRPVAPADLDGGVPIALPEVIRIAIDVDLFERLGIPANPDLFTAEAHVGEVTYRNGRAYFNGQPLQNEAAAELSELCRKAMHGQR